MERRAPIINRKGQFKMVHPRTACMNYVLKDKRFSSKKEQQEAFAVAVKFCSQAHPKKK